MDLEQWTVGGRGFGVVLIWLLLAGEQYTTYTFLGASGWANSRGGPVLYVIGVQPLIFVVSFYILPQVWEAGQKHRCGTAAPILLPSQLSWELYLSSVCRQKSIPLGTQWVARSSGDDPRSV
jgi:hypothetical protein